MSSGATSTSLRAVGVGRSLRAPCTGPLLWLVPANQQRSSHPPVRRRGPTPESLVSCLQQGYCQDEGPGQQKAPNGPPPSEARYRHLIKPATALNNPEDPGEHDASKKAEHAKPDEKRDVGGVKPDHQQEGDARAEPCYRPSEPHTECATDALWPLFHGKPSAGGSSERPIQVNIRERAGRRKPEARNTPQPGLTAEGWSREEQCQEKPARHRGSNHPTKARRPGGTENLW